MKPSISGQEPQFDDKKTGSAAKKERLEAKILAKTLALEMRITAAYLSDLEHGRRKWNSELVEKFNLAMKCLKKS